MKLGFLREYRAFDSPIRFDGCPKRIFKYKPAKIHQKNTNALDTCYVRNFDENSTGNKKKLDATSYTYVTSDSRYFNILFHTHNTYCQIWYIMVNSEQPIRSFMMSL